MVWANRVVNSAKISTSIRLHVARSATASTPRFLKSTREITRAIMRTVSTTSSMAKRLKTSSLCPCTWANSAVKTSTRRIAAIRPTRRNGSGTTVCSRNLDRVEQLDYKENQQDPVEERHDIRRQRSRHQMLPNVITPPIKRAIELPARSRPSPR